jgi:hypothetical protein
MKQDDPGESDLPMELAQPARRALVGAGYRRLEQFTDLSEAQVKHLHGVGPKALEQLRRALGRLGLSFADEQSRNFRSLYSRMKHETHGKDPAVLPFHHH